jgi:hypothetical protein
VTEFPYPYAARVQELLAAISSWYFVFWLVGLPFAASRTYIFVGLSASAALCLTSIVISFRMKCPKCGKSIAIIKEFTRLGPDWAAVRNQFFPVDALIGRPSVSVCPHCNITLRMPNPSFKRAPDGTA